MNRPTATLTPTTTAPTPPANPRPRYVLLIVLAGATIAGALIGLAITATTTSGTITSGPLVQTGLALTRATLDGSGVLTVGLSLLPLLLGRDHHPDATHPLATARLIALTSSAVLLIAALVSMLLEVIDINVGQPFTPAEIGQYVRGAGAGQAHIVVACAAFTYLLTAALAHHRGEHIPAELRLTLALVTLIPLSTAGHTAFGIQGLRNLALATIELHVLAAVCWTGGLLAVMLLLGLHPTLLAHALPRFSRLATVCVFTVGATGLFTGWFELYTTPGIHWYTAIITTRYGWILIGKALCVLTAGLLGGHTRFRLLPAITTRQPTAVATWTTIEIGVLALAFGLAAVLIRAPVVTT